MRGQWCEMLILINARKDKKKKKSDIGEKFEGFVYLYINTTIQHSNKYSNMIAI